MSWNLIKNRGHYGGYLIPFANSTVRFPVVLREREKKLRTWGFHILYRKTVPMKWGATWSYAWSFPTMGTPEVREHSAEHLFRRQKGGTEFPGKRCDTIADVPPRMKSRQRIEAPES